MRRQIVTCILAGFMALSGAACLPVSVPPTPSGPVTLVVQVHDFVTPTRPVVAAVSCDADGAAGRADADGHVTLTFPPRAILRCELAAEGYQGKVDTYSGLTSHVVTTWMEAEATAPPSTPTTPPVVEAPSSLRVDVNNRWFRNADGRADYREVSYFAGLSRMLRGEAETMVRPVLRVFRGLGFTATRVLLTLDGDYWHARSPIGYSLRSAPDMPGFWEQLDALVRIHAEEGLYVRLTPFGALEPFGAVWDPIARRDVFSGDVQRRGEVFALEVARRYATASNVLFEVANEPSNIGMRDSSQKIARLGCEMKRLAPHRLVGAGDINGMDFASFFGSCFDYVDRHVDRTDDLDFFASVKRMGEDPYRDDQPRPLPAISGEPVNFGENRVDGRTGDVATSPAVAYAYGAVTRARQIIPNFHFDGGLYSSMPKPETIELMRAFHRALDVFPMVDAQRWRGSWSADQGNYWDRRPYPGSDDEREVARHISERRGPWRVYGVGDWSVAFPYAPGWHWSGHLTAPADLQDRFVSGGYEVGIVRRRAVVKPAASLDVRPRSPLDDRRDVATSHSEDFTQSCLVGLSCMEARANLAHSVDHKLRSANTLAANEALFGHRVVDVVGRRAHEKVFWTHTASIVAMVAKEGAAKHGPSERQLPANSMSVGVAFATSAAADLAVAGRACAAGPDPATIRLRRLVDLLPEAIGERANDVRRCAPSRQGGAPARAESTIGVDGCAAALAGADRICGSHVTSLGSQVRGAAGADTPARSAYLSPPFAGIPAQACSLFLHTSVLVGALQ